MQQSRVTQDILARASTLSSATLHEAAGKIGALPSFIRPLTPSARLCARALPVKSPSGDNLWLHQAIYAAEAGEVLLVDTGADREYGYWGEIMAFAAQQKGIAGLVITGGVRDTRQLVSMNFPVFSGAVCIRGTAKDPAGVGTIGDPVTIGDVTIRRGDLLFADADGIVVIPPARALRVIEKAEARERDEEAIRERLRAGETTLAIYHLPVREADRR